MAISYSRSHTLIDGLLVGTGGAGYTGLSNTVEQLLVGISGQNTGANLITDLAFYNPNAATVFVQFFDVAATGSVSLGSTTATASYTIPSGSGVLQLNQSYSNGIAVAATTTGTGSTAAASAINIGVAYL